MRIGAEDPWALTELAKAGGGGGGGGLGGTPQLGNLPLRALVCDGAITGWLGYGYLRMRDYGSSLYMLSTQYRARRGKPHMRTLQRGSLGSRPSPRAFHYALIKH